ncbi:MAG: ABC transporter substrate-binding protein [Planctomycetota bacterium]
MTRSDRPDRREERLLRGPRRIVCLTEETTEALYAMGEEDRIVGISTFTRRPPRAAREKPKVSQFIRADVEAIRALEPDLVLAFSDLQADICAELIRAGLEVYAFNQRSVAGAIEMVRILGRLIDERAKGEALASGYERGLDEVRARAATLPRRPRVYFEEWPEPIITGIRWVAELVEIAGGVDCFPELREKPLAADRIVDPAEVVARAPDLYLASWCGKRFSPEEARARPGFAAAPFTVDERMREIDSLIILAPGPAALTDGVAALETEIRRAAALPPAGGGA